jgi:hypothetical protein
MGIADLLARDASDTNLVDEHPARQPVVDDAAAFRTTS